MSNNLRFEKNCNKKETENKENTLCDVRDGQQVFQNLQSAKGVEAQQCVKYVTNALPIDDNQSIYTSSGSAKSPSNSKPPVPAVVAAAGSSSSAPPQAKPRDQQSTSSRREKPSREQIAEKCYEHAPGRRIIPCDVKETQWQQGKYVQDDCGSGIVPIRKLNFEANRRIWCSTPLTTYQASHGELGRQILCGEKLISRRINPGPPCNVCEIVLPLCRGYYRKYECDFSPCERDYQEFKGGRARPRTKVERYWEPCLSLRERADVNKFAPQNMALAAQLKQRSGNSSCW